MFHILHTATAVLYRATVVSYTFSSVVLHSSKFRWKHNFVRINLKPNISASLMKRFTLQLYNVETKINPVVKERIIELIAEWNGYAIEKQFIGELINGSMTLNEVIYIVNLMLDKEYLPKYLIESVFNLSLVNFDKLVHNYDQACGLMLLALICSSNVPNQLFFNMHNYLERNIHLLSLEQVKYFYYAFGRSRWHVRYPLNKKFVSMMVEEMRNLHHNDIIPIFKSFIVSNFSDRDAVKKIATSLMENDKIHGLESDQHLVVYLTFFIGGDYFDEAVYDSLLQNFHFLATSSPIKLTNIKFSAIAFGHFGRIQFKPRNKLHREISEVIERICLDTQFKHDYFSDYNWICEFARGMIFFGFFSDNLLSWIFTSIDSIPDLEITAEKHIRSSSLTYVEDRPLDTIYNVLLDMLGPDCVHLYKILPYLVSQDIEIRLKYDGSVIAFEPETFLQRASSDLDDKEDLDVVKTVIIHLGRNSFLTGSPELKGGNAVKIRQLRLLGYHVLIIKKNELSDLPSLEERKAFMTNLIESSFGVKLKLPKKEGN